MFLKASWLPKVDIKKFHLIGLVSFRANDYRHGAALKEGYTLYKRSRHLLSRNSLKDKWNFITSIKMPIKICYVLIVFIFYTL